MKDFSQKARKVAGEAAHVTAQARRSAGEMTENRRGQIEAALDQAGRFVDTRTEGKYTTKIAKARQAAGKGVDFVAKQKSTRVPPRPGLSPQGPVIIGPAGTAVWKDDQVQDRPRNSDVPTGWSTGDQSASGGAGDAAGSSGGAGSGGPGRPYSAPIPPYDPGPPR
ncbi:antitoxin [Austwickia chelonae]|uniref:antitoxin n=1 Tax=Austwickia chelonae TaxID=100225 RepID=UPI001F083B0D|nr:antitoxin [Austwickia chelonae]